MLCCFRISGWKSSCFSSNYLFRMGDRDERNGIRCREIALVSRIEVEGRHNIGSADDSVADWFLCFFHSIYKLNAIVYFFESFLRSVLLKLVDFDSFFLLDYLMQYALPTAWSECREVPYPGTSFIGTRKCYIRAVRTSLTGTSKCHIRALCLLAPWSAISEQWALHLLAPGSAISEQWALHLLAPGSVISEHFICWHQEVPYPSTLFAGTRNCHIQALHLLAPGSAISKHFLI